MMINLLLRMGRGLILRFLKREEIIQLFLTKRWAQVVLQGEPLLLLVTHQSL